MTHFHMNERIDTGHPVNNGTASDRDSLADALREIIPAFALLGWELTKWEISGWQNTHVEFTTKHDNHVHILNISIWGCTCSTGEAELREHERQVAAPWN